MRDAKRSFEVRCSVSGELKVLVVDATANHRKFEHQMTEQIVEGCHKAGIPVTSNSPVLAQDVKSFADAFTLDEPWNVLLLISHGRAVSAGPDVLRLGDLRTNWYLANAIDMKLEDKAVFLGVCEGACEDATYVLLRDQLALILTAPTRMLSSNDAIAFFPAALADLLGKKEITPEDVNSAIKKNNHLAGDKMTLLSAVGLAE